MSYQTQDGATVADSIEELLALHRERKNIESCNNGKWRYRFRRKGKLYLGPTRGAVHEAQTDLKAALAKAPLQESDRGDRRCSRCDGTGHDRRKCRAAGAVASASASARIVHVDRPASPVQDRRRGPRSEEQRARISAAARAAWTRRKGLPQATPAELARADRLVAIERWARRRHVAIAADPIAQPGHRGPAAAPPPPLVCRTFAEDEDFAEFYTEPPPSTEAGAGDATPTANPAPASPAPALPRPIVPTALVSALIPSGRLLHRRKNGRIRAKTVSIPLHGHLLRDELARAEAYPEDVDRPATREACKAMARPCPFVSCSHHLYLDVNQETGAIKLNFPHLEVWEMAETCSLDVADKGGITLEEVGAILNLTRERIRQVETRGIERIKRRSDYDLELPPDRGN